MLTCIDPTIKTPALLWNGLIGVRINRDGSGVERGMLTVDGYEATGEERIQPVTNFCGLRWTLDGKPLEPTSSTDYRQALDMRTGILTTTWRERGAEISSEAIVSPSAEIWAERWTIKPAGKADITWQAPEIGRFNASTTTGSRSDSFEGYTYTDTVKMQGQVDGKWNDSGWGGKVGGEVSLERVLVLTPRYAKIRTPETRRFADVEKASREVWAKRWQSDIEIEGPVEDQQAIRSFLFYLRSAFRADGSDNPRELDRWPALPACSPFALSDATYSGHIFWDADIWLFPALNLIDPHQAKAIPTYRLQRRKAAEENFDAWLNAGRPTAGKPLGRIEDMQANPSKGLKFPWESSVSGHETVPGPSRFEDHITGDVAFSLGQARALGMVDDTQFGRILREATEFWSNRWEIDSKGAIEIKDVMSVDESHTGDNDLYTNLLAQWCISGGRGWSGPLQTAGDAAAELERAAPATTTFKLPRDAKSFLTYDNDLGRGYKQAAAVLSIYPLQYPPAENEEKTMMERFADQVIKNGPAMSDAIHSIIWSRLGDEDRAYDAWRKSWQPFTNHPLMLFSEKRTKDTCYFTTGAAGSLQSVLYGFLGFRLDYKKQDGAAWSLPLRGGSWLSVKPHLPPSWKSVKFKNFTVLGHRYTLTATPTEVHVTQGD